jgi:hypothetical protein
MAGGGRQNCVRFTAIGSAFRRQKVAERVTLCCGRLTAVSSMGDLSRAQDDFD